MINRLAQLSDAISAALGRPCSLSHGHDAGAGPYSLHTHPNGTKLRVNYDDSLPTNAADADVVIQAFNDTPTEGERLDGAAPPARVLAALTLRMSTQWAALPAPQKTRVQTIIDAAANAVIAKLT